MTRGELEDAFIEFIGDDVAAGEARERLEESLAMLAEKRLVTTS
jgi:hypothetical protein